MNAALEVQFLYCCWHHNMQQNVGCILLTEKVSQVYPKYTSPPCLHIMRLCLISGWWIGLIYFVVCSVMQDCTFRNFSSKAINGIKTWNHGRLLSLLKSLSKIDLVVPEKIWILYQWEYHSKQPVDLTYSHWTPRVSVITKILIFLGMGWPILLKLSLVKEEIMIFDTVISIFWLHWLFLTKKKEMNM